MNKILIPALLTIILGGGVFYLTSVYESERDQEEGVICTADAMQCPDGTYVGRSGPNCEFVCPENSVGEFWGVITGSVWLGPTCPVEREPPDPQCADKPYAASLVLTTLDGAQIIKEFNSDAEGKFYIEMPPGQYAIRSAAAANILPYCQTQPFEVPANDFVQVVVSCDTGIR